MDMQYRYTRHAPQTLSARLGRTLLIACLTIAAGGKSQESKAQWFVQDPTAIAKAVQEYTEQAKRWVDTAEHYKNTIQHYADQVAFWQQHLVKLQGLKFQLFAVKNQFKRVAADYGVREECPGLSGGFSGDITAALQSFLPDMGGDVVKQQTQLCELIVMSKNAKYNITVDYLQFVALASQDLETVSSDRLSKVSESPANLQSILTDTERFSSNLDTAREQWQTNMKQQDTQIAMLNQMQGILSRRAMNGQPSRLGTLINTAALRAAFID